MTRLEKIDPHEPDPVLIKQAADILKAGGILAYPTETLYALGVDALNPEALERLFLLKGRDPEKPMPVIVTSKEMLMVLIKEFPVEAEVLAQRFWPGPLTLVLRAAPGLPANLTGPGLTLAARVSSHPIARSLAKELGGPVTATSANLSGKPELITAKEIECTFSGKLDMVLDSGPAQAKAPSTIVDLTQSPKVVREGAISAHELAPFLQRSSFGI